MAHLGIFRVAFENRDALTHFNKAMDILIEAAKERPWDGEVREALDELAEAGKGLTIMSADKTGRV